jgi:hypothetical protein
MKLHKYLPIAFMIFFSVFFLFEDIHLKFGYILRIKNIVDFSVPHPNDSPSSIQSFNFDSSGIAVYFPPAGRQGLNFHLSDNIESARIWVKTKSDIKLMKFQKKNPDMLKDVIRSNILWIKVLATGYSDKDEWWNPQYVLFIKN